MSTISFNKIYPYKWMVILAIIVFITGISCRKPSPEPVAEEQIVFNINPDPGTTVLAALATTQDFAVTINSKLPTAGVNVDLKLTKDADGTVVFSQSLKSSSSSLMLTFQNLGTGVICTGTIKITSASKATNNAIKTFKIAKK